MPKRVEPPANGRPRRRGTKSQTRERLIRSALDLLHTGGEGAVTTVSVTRAAGVVQSMFYRHFANVEACLAAAAEKVVGHIRDAVAGARRAMYQAGPGVGEDLERFCRGVFELAGEHRPVVQLFLRHRSDPLALGGVMHRLAEDLRSDLARDLADQAGRSGLALPPAWVEATADGLVGATLSAIEARLDGRGPGADEAARVLAAFSTGACLAVIEALRADAGRGA